LALSGVSGSINPLRMPFKKGTSDLRQFGFDVQLSSTASAS
jgi:hypothetical protein